MVKPVVDLFGNTNLFNTPQTAAIPKEHMKVLQPIEVETLKLSQGAAQAGSATAEMYKQLEQAQAEQTAYTQKSLQEQDSRIKANMEAVLRMQEERRKAEEEAKKEAERKAKEEEKARKEALKELEDAVKDDPLTLVRQDMEALFNSDAYKEAGDVQRRDLINAMATDLEKALREKGLKQELITKSINAFKTAGSQNVDKYIADSEKDDWDPIDDLIKPVISGFKKGQAANAVKDSAIIDKAIADLKAGKEVSGWAVDEILDRDPSLRKYMTNTGVYSSITQGVGSSFKLRAGVADEFSKAAGKTWQSAIDDATNYDKTAKELDRQRSADTVRHHKNYEYELAKIENDEKSGKIGWLDSMLSQGMVAISNPTVTLDKIAPSTATFIAETATLQGAAAATGAVVGGAAGLVVGGVSTAGAGAIPTALAWGKAGAAIGAGLANGGKVVKYIAAGINYLRNGVVSAEMTEDEIINNTREQLMALDVKNEADLKKLKSLPYWDEMVARSDGNLELAKVRMSAFASQDAAFAGSIVAAATGILGPEAILSKGLTGVIVKSALKKPVVGMAVTGKTAGAVALASVLEGGEEAMTQYLTNFATAYGSSDESLTKRIREAMNNDPSLLDGTAGAFAQGAIGGGMVAGIGAGMQLRGDIKTTTEANTAHRIATDATSYNREGVEALKTALTSNDKLDKAFIEETVHKAMRSHTRDLSAYAKYYDATAEQTAQQEVYDNIIEPALEGSQLTTEQIQDVIKKLSLVYDNLNTNKYAIAEETPLLKAMQAETLEEAEKIYGQPLSTLRADTWRVLNNKDTSVVADLEHAQATAEVIRNILQGGGENTIQRSNNVLRTVFGYTDEATNKYHDGILQRYRLDDSKIDAILEMARNDLDAYRRRGLDNEQETKQPSAQTGRHPNGGTVPQDGGPSRSQDSGTVRETATGSQTQDQPTDSTGLGGQDTTGQTTADTESGGSRGKRQATATKPATSSTQEADRPATGTTETQGTVPNTDSPTATRPVSETPTVDGGNGPQSQTPEYTGPANTPTESTPTSGRSTGATPTERSADGERTTATASIDLDDVQNILSKLSDEEYNTLRQFAYALGKRKGFVKSINDVSSLRIAYSFTFINFVSPPNRVARVEQIYREAGTLAHFTDTELKAYASTTVDIYNKVMDLAAREANSSDKKDSPATDTQSKKGKLSSKKPESKDESATEPKSKPKTKGKLTSTKDKDKDKAKAKAKAKTKAKTEPVAEPTAEEVGTEPTTETTATETKPKGKLTSTKTTTKRGTKNDEETSTGEQTTAPRTDDETSGGRSTGATPTERSADGERTTTPTEAAFEQLKEAIERLPKEDFEKLKMFTYLAYKERLGLAKKQDVTVSHIADVMTVLGMMNADARQSQIASVYRSRAAKRYKYTAEDIESITENILGIFDRLMQAVASGDTSGKKTHLGSKAKTGTATEQEPTANAETPTEQPPVDKPKAKAKPKTKAKPKLTSKTKDKPNDEETSTGEQTATPRTDDETSESGSRADAKPSDEQSGTVREQSPVNDGKKQTAKSTKPDVGQEAEVAPFGTLEANTSADTPSYAEPKWRRGSLSYPNKPTEWFKSQGAAAARSSRQEFIASYGEAKPVKEAMINELNDWYKVVGDTLFESPLFPILHELLNRTSVVAPHFVLRVNKRATGKDRFVGGHHNAISGTLWLNKKHTTDYITSLKGKNPSKEDIVFAITQALITPVHELVHAVTVNNITKPENSLALNSLLSMRDMIIDGIGRPRQHYNTAEFLYKMSYLAKEKNHSNGRSVEEIISAIAYGLSLNPVGGGASLRIADNSDRNSINEFIAVGMSDPAMAALIDQYVDVKALLKEYPELKNIIKNRKRTAWQAFSDIVLSVLGKKKSPSPYDVYQAVVESVMYEKNSPYIEAMRKDHAIANSKIDNTSLSGTLTYEQYLALVSGAREALTADTLANVESLVPPTTLEEFKQRIRKKDTKGLPTQEVVDIGVMKGTKPTDPMVSENWNYSQASIDILTNDLLNRPMPKWTTKAIVKAILEAIPETIKKSMAVVSIALATTLGTAMTVPVDAQASTTTYTQTVLSQQVKDTASHVVQTKDNDGKPFIVADKLSGNITLFDANGKVLETAGALFGSEVGDTINSAEQRATPAGRFELAYSKASDTKMYGSHLQQLSGTKMTGADGTEYVWAIHRVINPKGENRLNRLSSKTASDNRISNGCINVPAEFFNKHLDKPFDGVLYVLPETANFNGTLFNNSTVSDSTTATEQSGRSASQTGTDSKQTTDKQTDTKADKTPATSESTTEKPELTSEQIKSLGTSRLLTDRDLAENVAETLRTTLPDAPAQVSTEPARMSDNPSSQTALIDPVTVDGTTYNTVSVNEGQTTPAEERADGTFDTLPTTQTSSDGYGVFDIAVALGGLFAVGGVVRFRRKRKNGKVEVVAEVEKGSNDDTTTDTVEATEPKPTKEKTKKTKLTSRKKSEKLGFNPDNPTELAKAIREQLYALEDLQTNVQAQNLLMALAGKPNVGSIMYAASYNTMVREINNSFNDRTKAQVDAGFDDEQTLDWRGIRKKGAKDDITATNLVAKAFNRYIQFAGGATPTLDTYLKDAGAKRIGILQDSYALSAALAKIPAVRNALFGRFATQMLKPIDREMQKVTFNAEYAKRIRALHGRSPKQGELGYDIAHDFGMYATLQHGLEAWDWFVKSREYTAEEYTKQADKAIERIKQDLESKAPHEVEQILELVKAGNHVELEQMFDAYGMTTSMRSRIKTLTSSYGKLTRKAQDIRDETEAIEAYYENESGITGATAYPLPIGMVKADIEAKIKELENLYGKDDLDKMAKRLYDGYAYAVRDSVMHGGYTAQQLEQIKAPKFKKYVALYKRKEKETDTSGDIYQATELDAWTQAGLTSKEVLTLGLTPDMTRFHREGMTTPPDDAYTNLRSFAQNQMGRAAESELKREIQELAESFGEEQIPFDKLTYDPTKAQHTAIKGLVRIPADTKNGHIPDNLKNVVPIRARGVYYELVQDPNNPKKSTYEPREADFNYYFTDSNIQREITHKSETNEKLKRGMFTGNLYTIQRWQASMMTRLRPVWNFWNFVKEASERTITLLYRPVADEDGKRINSFTLAKDNLKNLAKLSTDLEAQAQITNYIMYREVVTPLQRMLAEMDEAGALQLYTSTVDRHNAMDTETKSALDILSEHAHKNAKKLASKYKATEKAMESAEALADWYQTRLVETPQVVNALAVFMTYKQNNVNRKEAANRVRDMFDPLRTQEPLINKLAAFFPFVRSAMAGNYNTARTLDIMTQDRQAMLATVLGVMASFALLGLALAALGDDDETGEPLWERLTFDDLARGVPVRLFGNDVFFAPVGFGMPNLLWSIAAGVFSGINNGFDFQDAVAGISTTAIKNLLPVSLPTGESNSSMKGVILMFMPAMVKPLMEVALNQKAFGGSSIVRNQNIPEGYSKAEVSQWSTPEAYKDMAMTLSSMGIDMHPEQLRHLMQNYFFVGPFRAMDAMLQDKGDKTGGVMMDKGETVGPILAGLGVDISYQPDRFSMRNAFYELQKLEKEILRKYDVREKLSGADTLDDTTEFIGMDGLDDSMIKKDDSNLARIRNELVAKGATLDEVQMVLDIRTADDAYTKANREAGNEAIHYLRGLEKGEFSDVSSPDVYREKFLAAHYDMQTVVKKHIHLLTED